MRSSSPHSAITAVQAPPKAHHNAAGGPCSPSNMESQRHGAAHARPVNTNVTPYTRARALAYARGKGRQTILLHVGQGGDVDKGVQVGLDDRRSFHEAVTLKRCTPGLRGASTASFNRKRA